MKLKLYKIESLLLLIGSAMLPIYAFNSGGVQISHAIFAVFAGISLFKYGVPLTLWAACLLFLTVYSFSIESVYVLLGGNPKYIINSMFFFYNFLITCAIYSYIHRNGLSAIMPGIMIASGVALISVLVNGVDLRELGESGRATGAFNNPNQLGYFSVCLLSLTYLFYRSGSIGYWIAAGLLAVAIFLAILSLSKAAMVSNLIVIILALKPRSPKAIRGWLIATFVGTLVLFQQFQNGAFDGYLFIERLVNLASEEDSSLVSRGYLAFQQGTALQILFGLGTQGVATIIGHEVHSTFGSIFNNYGFFGFSFVFTAFYLWAKRVWSSYGFYGFVCLAAPAMFYGITHNGMRFTIFWLLFATSMAMARRAEKQGQHNDMLKQTLDFDQTEDYDVESLDIRRTI